MLLMYGIAAFAVIANGLDQGGVDPQVDKQYAIVKPGERITPASNQSTSTNTVTNDDARGFVIRTDGQDGAIAGQGSTTTTTQIAPAGIAVQGQRTESYGTTIVVTGQSSAPAAPRSILTGPGVPMSPSQGTAAAPYALNYGDNGLARLKGMDRPVSVQFTNAAASEVLRWLSKQNVNFVANVDNLPKSKITMNVSHVPLHEALETVAEALGGSWQIKGSTLVFRRGMFRALQLPASPFGGVKSFSGFPSGDMKLFSQMDPTQLKAFQLQQKKMSEDLAKQLKDRTFFYGDGKTFTYKFDPKQLEELKALKMDGKAFTMDPKQLEQFKSLGMMRDGKTLNFQWDPKNFGELKPFNGFTFKKIDVEKFKKSLTNSQKELMKKQGYLKLSDLTEEQGKMLFDKTNGEIKGDVTFVFGSDDQKITIKSR